MAQVDIGKIKIVWKGPWNSGTAYTVDDAVSHSGNSYICIQAGTNQNPSSATAYWQVMATAGTNGTNGTDLTSTLGTQGQIVYRDGSGLAALNAGTAGQVLQTGGSGANPSWGTVSSDFVKITSTHTTSGSASTINYQNIFDDAVYGGYMINWNVNSTSSSAGGMKARFLNGSSAYSGSTNYRRAGVHAYRRTDQSDNQVGGNNDANGTDTMTLEGWGNNPSYNTFGHIVISGNLNESSNFPVKYLMGQVVGREGSSPDYVFGDYYYQYFDGGVVNGIQFFRSAAMQKVAITIWGMKK